VIPWLLVTTAAHAAVTVDRPADKAEAGELTLPDEHASTADMHAWRVRAERRVDLAAVDAAVRWRMDRVEACLAKAPAGAATLQLKVTVGPDGSVTRTSADKAADPTFLGCVQSAYAEQPLGVLLHDPVNLTYTFHADAAPPAAAVPVAADPAAAPAPGATAPADAFSPALDAERGFSGVPWGARCADFEGMSAGSVHSGTTLYTRTADAGARWYGVPIQGLTYGCAEDGLYVAIVGVRGTASLYALRQALQARYGASRWDVPFGAYYWRGERVLLEARPAPGTDAMVVTLLDMAGARATGLADRLPGDRPAPGNPAGDRRLPHIFSSTAAEPAPAEPTPAPTPAPAEPAPAPPPAAPTPASPPPTP
jgi:hypothetical protein